MNSIHNPPRFFVWLLERFCHREWLGSIEGDLTELYHERIARLGKTRADVAFAIDVILVLRPSLVRSFSFQPAYSIPIIRSYFTVGWRNLFRSKIYSFINVGGLSAGMAVTMVIALWVYDELSFNTWFKNYDRIAQVTKAGNWQGKFYEGQKYVPFPLIDELQTTYGANFRHVVPISGPGGFEAVLSTGEKMLTKRGMYIGESAPEMFTWEMIEGSRDGLNSQHGIMISASMAKAFFGDESPIQKTMRVNNYVDVVVTGVFKDFPRNTEFYGLDFFKPWSFYLTDAAWVSRQGWDNNFLYVYVELAEGKSFEEVGENILRAQSTATENLDYMRGDREAKPEVHLLPMRDWHLYADYRDGQLQHGPMQLVWFVGAIGVFVVILACINFMNLSTARSARRAREVGIRKTIGSLRRQLVTQFYSESLLIVIISFVMAIVCVYSMLPWFNELAGKQMIIPFRRFWFWFASICFLFITALLAGTYPALYLSSFNPVKTLKGVKSGGKLAALPRKVLVVAQFSISLILIICTSAIYHQLIFVKSRPVGYSREGLLMMRKNSSELDIRRDVLRNELKKTGAVLQVAESGGSLMGTWSHNVGFSWEGKDPAFDPGLATLNVSPEFGETVGWEVVEGRDFSVDVASDSTAIVLNEAAVDYLGIEQPIGMTIHWSVRSWNIDQDYHVVGVVKDMVMNSPFDPVKPAVYLNYKYGNVLLIRITPGTQISEALPKIEKVFKSHIPDMPFDYRFVDREFATKFANEERVGELSAVFAGLGIMISCLGLLGLTSFVAEQRTKEIGIRKILGATVSSLWRMLSQEFVILVVCSCIIAMPLSWAVLQKGLENYEYKTDVGWEIFVMASVGILVLSLATVSYQTVKAALANPVKSIRAD